MNSSLSLLDVCVSEYSYISKENIGAELTGFTSKDVRDCVCGFISSDQGFGFFHFYRLNDPVDLRERLVKDFKDATSLKIILFGGNPVNAFLPWREKNRELKFDSEKILGNYFVETKDESYEFSKRIFLDEILPFLKRCRINQTQNNFFDYDLSVIKEKFKGKDFEVAGFENQSRFKVQGMKDFVGFQNLAKVINVLTETTLFNKDNIEHHYCTAGFSVVVFFNGVYRAYQNQKSISLNYKNNFARYMTEASFDKIKDADQIIENRSIKGLVEL